LTHAPGSGITGLSWSPPPIPGAGIVRYDTLRSTSPSDFVAAATCLETDGADTGSIDGVTPPAGSAYFYLVRVENDCPGSPGSLGRSSAGLARIGRTCP
jgi:hypothetical protein